MGIASHFVGRLSSAQVCELGVWQQPRKQHEFCIRLFFLCRTSRFSSRWSKAADAGIGEPSSSSDRDTKSVANLERGDANVDITTPPRTIQSEWIFYLWRCVQLAMSKNDSKRLSFISEDAWWRLTCHVKKRFKAIIFYFWRYAWWCQACDIKNDSKRVNFLLWRCVVTSCQKRLKESNFFTVKMRSGVQLAMSKKIQSESIPKWRCVVKSSLRRQKRFRTTKFPQVLQLSQQGSTRSHRGDWASHIYIHQHLTLSQDTMMSISHIRQTSVRAIWQGIQKSSLETPT